MKFATFDLETDKIIPGNNKLEELGITCAALGMSGIDEPRFFHNSPKLTQTECIALVHTLEQTRQEGYVLVTWNGTGFDFAMLAKESGMPRECAALALAHVDLMAILTFKRGHYLGLQKALDGAGIPGKLKEVRLNDGTILKDFTGIKAPEYWAKGEFNAVLSYLREDVMPLLELADFVYRKKQIRWTSQRGVPSAVPIEKLYTVRECFNLPLPNTAWMRLEPADRNKFIEWMPPLDSVIPAPSFAQRDVRELPLFKYSTEEPYWREIRYLLQMH